VKITRFEEIKAWQEARSLAKMIYKATKADRSFNRDYRLRDQITSAAVSIMSNISEGFSRRYNKEFIQFLFIAKGSTSEVQSQLYVALDQGYVTKNKFNELYSQAEKTAKLISNFITYLLGSKSAE
jgi:four helix bundle protein